MSSSDTAAHSSPPTSATSTTPRGARLESSWASRLSSSASAGTAWRRVSARGSAGSCWTGPRIRLMKFLVVLMEGSFGLRRALHIGQTPPLRVRAPLVAGRLPLPLVEREERPPRSGGRARRPGYFRGKPADAGEERELV